jgi:branched-chain amino acid transport system ATP-binding protein
LAADDIIVLDDVVLGYKRSVVVHGVSLVVPTGAKVAMLGANGAGKSTVLKAVSGFVRPRRGRILLEGEEISGLPPVEIVRRGVIHVPEGRRVFANLSVAENLRVAAYTIRGDPQPQIDRVLEIFPNLQRRYSVNAGLLSGGEQQMLAVGRAIMARPRVLLLDELSLGLAPITARTVYDAMGAVFDVGLSVLLVEQNARLALQRCDYV